MDSIFRVTFGYEVGTLKPELPITPFAEAFAETNEIASSRFFRPFWKLQRLLNVGPEAALAKSAKVWMTSSTACWKLGKQTHKYW